MGDGSSEGADGFVASAEIAHMIMHDGRLFVIHDFPKPYTEDPESASESISDLRIRSLFREHHAWFSCDAMGVDGTT